MSAPEPVLSFRPSADVAALLNALLDAYERRDPRQPIRRAVRVQMADVDLPGYDSQLDPAPRLTANEQIAELARAGLVQIAWEPGEEYHLLQAVTLAPEHAHHLFAWLERTPVTDRRLALQDLLLGDRFRFAQDDWRRRAVDHILGQLRANLSPAPFTLDDPGFNRELMAALVALDDLHEETPYRVFSVRTYNDSKAFERVKGGLATLARHHGWPHLSPEEALRELGLVANPTHLLLSGPWRLNGPNGRTVALEDFHPAAGIPALMAERLERVTIDPALAGRVICVENLASFYELVRREGEGLAALCLMGNPAPPVRHLLSCLAAELPDHLPLMAWNDLDFGGMNILAQLRAAVSPRFIPYRMDVATLEAHARWAKPLTASDRRLLARLRGWASLSDLHPVIDHMLARGLKLEQEAIQL